MQHNGTVLLPAKDATGPPPNPSSTMLLGRVMLARFTRISLMTCSTLVSRGPAFCFIFASFDRATINQKSSPLSYTRSRVLTLRLQHARIGYAHFSTTDQDLEPRPANWKPKAVRSSDPTPVQIRDGQREKRVAASGTTTVFDVTAGNVCSQEVMKLISTSEMGALPPGNLGADTGLSGFRSRPGDTCHSAYDPFIAIR